MFLHVADAYSHTPTGERSSPHASRRTHQPVRRKSHLAGREGTFWRPTSRKEVSQVVLAARRYELAGRQGGRMQGPLGFVAIEILDLFANMVSFRTGQLDPSIDTLMRMLKRSRDAIVRALKALRAHGFLDWLRRYVPTGSEGRGPQVQQTSNAYRLSLPKKALQWLGWHGRDIPLPDDHTHALEQQEAERRAFAATLSPEAFARHIVEDDGLAASLARLGKAISERKERESEARSESRASF